MIRSPDQALYDLLYEALSTLPCEIYAVNPPINTPYPYIQMGQTQAIPVPNKTRYIAKIYQTIDVWGDITNRFEISNLANRIFRLANRLAVSPEGYRFVLDLDQSNHELMVDNSTNDDLWRARVSLRFTLL